MSSNVQGMFKFVIFIFLESGLANNGPKSSEPNLHVSGKTDPQQEQ
jgi:hypothetical protein